MTQDEVNQKLRQKGITQAEFARRCHVSQAAASLFFKKKMTSERLEKRLARILGVTLEVLRAPGEPLTQDRADDSANGEGL